MVQKYALEVAPLPALSSVDATSPSIIKVLSKTLVLITYEDPVIILQSLQWQAWVNKGFSVILYLTWPQIHLPVKLSFFSIYSLQTIYG